MPAEGMIDDPSTALHALVAGGGSGGHVFPGLAVGAELAARGWRVSWLGRAGGMEERLVGARGLPFHALPARAVVGRGPLAAARAGATLAGSGLRARRLIRGRGVGLVVGTGGFVSAPGVVGAALARRPALLVEPNARAGAANRWLSRLARAAALGYEGAARDFRCRVEVTGVPVRREFFDLPGRPEAGPPRLLVLGGSQGALQFNRLLPGALERLSGRIAGLEVVHQVGARHLEATRAAYAARALGSIRVTTEPFLDDVAGEMGRADVVISRAGAVTLAEICAAGRPAVLVPLAIARGHQAENAAALAAAGAAVLLAGDAAQEERLADAVAGLFADRERRHAMGAAARALARPGAAAAIADLAEGMVARR